MKNWIHHVLLAGSSEGAYIVCSLISVLLLLHFMKCHRWVQRCNWNHGFFPMNQSAGTKILVTSCYSRDHVLKLYRGQRTFYQDVFVSPANLVVGIFTKTPRNFVPPSLLFNFHSYFPPPPSPLRHFSPLFSSCLLSSVLWHPLHTVILPVLIWCAISGKKPSVLGIPDCLCLSW